MERKRMSTAKATMSTSPKMPYSSESSLGRTPKLLKSCFENSAIIIAVTNTVAPMTRRLLSLYLLKKIT